MVLVRIRSIAWIVAGLGALTCAAGLVRLEAHFDPAALLDLEPSVHAESRWFDAHFGAHEAATVFVLRTDDVRAPAALDRLHSLSQRAAVFGRATSLTTVPTPHAGEGDLDAVLSLIESAPSVFPNGLADVGRRLGGELVVSPVGGEGPLSDAEHRVLSALAPRFHGQLVDAAHTRALVVLEGDVSPRHRIGRWRRNLMWKSLAYHCFRLG